MTEKSCLPHANVCTATVNRLLNQTNPAGKQAGPAGTGRTTAWIILSDSSAASIQLLVVRLRLLKIREGKPDDPQSCQDPGYEAHDRVKGTECIPRIE